MSLQINNLSKSFAARSLFSNVSFGVDKGECVSLVGSNGSGKTTLMRIITGDEQADGGSVVCPKESKIGYLPQEIFLISDRGLSGSLTLWQLVVQAFEPLHAMKRELELIEAEMSNGVVLRQDEYERLSAEYKSLGGYSWQAKAIRLLNGFGFSEKRFHEPLSSFSGGWQMRAYFVRLLLSEPDYLLLDEPTNYLDISSISFLEDYLSGFKGGILVVSHDRYFLDALADSVVSIESDKARVFSGNYSQYLEARSVWAKEAIAAQNRQDRERKRVERFVERFRYKATKASAVQSRIKQLEKLEKISQIRALPKLHFSFPKCEAGGEVVMKCENICKSFGDNHVLDNVSFTINRGDRLAITGENGSGKTTLARILSGGDSLYTGSLENGYKVRLGYFAQDEEISFEGDETIYERMLRDTPFDAVPQLRSILGAFLFSGDDIDKKVKLLSGGEKSRLGLARLMLKPCNLLLLDEPTNHLDINSREALLNALDAFEGTVIIISHDRFFLDTLATRILNIENKKATLYEGNYSEYLWAKSHRKMQTSEGEAENPNKPNSSSAKQVLKDRLKMQKHLSNRLQKLKKEITEAEDKVSEIENEISSLEGMLASPGENCTPEHITKIGNQHKNAVGRLNEAMKYWEELHDENNNTASKLAELKEEVANATK